jgi:hypothetical protein
MRARIHKFKRATGAVLLFGAAMTLISCATEKKQVALVNDPDAKKDSQIPWNRQEKWEVGGQLQQMVDPRQQQ